MVLNYKKNIIIYYKWLEQLEKMAEEGIDKPKGRIKEVGSQ